ncbi:uncharacterized protein LOC117783560 [Drosophila innubila]|uniref:uncharacterized protein LOC117783560 n=1 Tax=Drosophila innubila TaxID=198719 RepID=UPI00148E01EC|nr:uncharacterized protein LOC117783560 [Drosophila innubila]
MKSIGFALFCLLCTVAWAQDDEGQLGLDAAPLTIAVTPFINEIEATTTYGLSRHKATWLQAELICRGVGFTLVNIPSETMQNRVQSFLETTVGDDYQKYGDSPIWTSGSNQGVNTKYVWHSSGERILYNRYLVTPPTSTRCIGYNIATDFWSNHDCKEQRYFLCQKFTLGKCE